MEQPDEKMVEMLFMQMLISLNEAGMIQLGKEQNPMSHEHKKDLQQAQGTIDLMLMLQAKTKGNLSRQEQELLDRILSNLEMIFTHEQGIEQKTEAVEVGGDPKPTPQSGRPPLEVEKPDDDENAEIGKRPGMEN